MGLGTADLYNAAQWMQISNTDLYWSPSGSSPITNPTNGGPVPLGRTVNKAIRGAFDGALRLLCPRPVWQRATSLAETGKTHRRVGGGFLADCLVGTSAGLMGDIEEARTLAEWYMRYDSLACPACFGQLGVICESLRYVILVIVWDGPGFGSGFGVRSRPRQRAYGAP